MIAKGEWIAGDNLLTPDSDWLLPMTLAVKVMDIKFAFTILWLTLDFVSLWLYVFTRRPIHSDVV
jgi:hypothetical protein